jgi:hypothetical protein
MKGYRFAAAEQQDVRHKLHIAIRTTSVLSELNNVEAHQFATVASEFCALLETAPHSSCADLLLKLDRALPLLYHAAASLPDVEPDTTGIASVTVPQQQVDLVQTAIAKKLGRWGAYVEMYNPADASVQKPVAYLLSLDLGEIYQDLRESLAIAQSGAVTTNDVLWEWRFSFSSHWGTHAARALRVLNALVHTEFAHVLAESNADA